MSVRHVRWLLLGLTVLVLAVAIALPATLPDERGQGWPFFLLLTAQALTFSTVGLVLIGAQPTQEELAVRLRDELDIAAKSEDLRVLVHRSLQPRHVSVWLPKRGASS